MIGSHSLGIQKIIDPGYIQESRMHYCGNVCYTQSPPMHQREFALYTYTRKVFCYQKCNPTYCMFFFYRQQSIVKYLIMDAFLKDTSGSPKTFSLYSSNTLLISQRGQSPNKGQKDCPKVHVLYWKIPLLQ